jgi:hypothetical protein
LAEKEVFQRGKCKMKKVLFVCVENAGNQMVLKLLPISMVREKLTVQSSGI